MKLQLSGVRTWIVPFGSPSPKTKAESFNPRKLGGGRAGGNGTGGSSSVWDSYLSMDLKIHEDAQGNVFVKASLRVSRAMATPPYLGDLSLQQSLGDGGRFAAATFRPSFQPRGTHTAHRRTLCSCLPYVERKRALEEGCEGPCDLLPSIVARISVWLHQSCAKTGSLEAHPVRLGRLDVKFPSRMAKKYRPCTRLFVGTLTHPRKRT